MSRLEVFETIEELKADRVERNLSPEEILRQKRATNSLTIFHQKRKYTTNGITI